MLFEKLITILPLTRINPEPSEINEAVARDTLGSFQALWHPAVLSRSKSLPAWCRASEPPAPGPNQVILLPATSRPALPYGWEEQAISAGAKVIGGGDSRGAFLSRLAAEFPDEISRAAVQLAADGFFALALARLYLEMLTAYMSHVSTIDEDHLQKEVLAAAGAAVVHDHETCNDHLRASFQVIMEARERLYSADIHLLDCCLVDPLAGLDRLGAQLNSDVPVNVFASGRSVERLQESDPAAATRLKTLLDDGKAELVGGEYDEIASTLLPLESHLWQFARGETAYRNILGRVPVVFGRRRFGLARHVLQLLNRLEFMHLTHFCFDDGVFPIKTDPKVRWESPDSSTVEALARIPFAADSAAEFLRFPWRLSRTIAVDFLATLSLVHWPMPEAPWYADLRNISRFANIFGKFSTLSHYFQSTDPSSISAMLSNDDYQSPFLAYDHRSGSSQPVSMYPAHHRLRARLEQIRWMNTVVQGLTDGHSEAFDSLDAIEAEIERDQWKDDDRRLAHSEHMAAQSLADVVAANAGGTPGKLLLNSLGFHRRFVIPIPAKGDGAEGAAATDLTDSRWVSVEVPALGFAWIPDDIPTRSGEGRAKATVDERTIRNEHLEVEIDAATGGIRSFRDHTIRFPQLGQQLVMVGIAQHGADSASGTAGSGSERPIEAEMRATSFVTKSTGSDLASLAVEGELVADRCPAWTSDPIMARFRQTYRLGRGDRVLRVHVEILGIQSGAIDSRAGAWQSYVGSRVAWTDPRSVLLRGVGPVAEMTRSRRPESPYFLEIHGRRNRVALFTGGLPFHQRVGQRMLDTLLVTATEGCRSFEFGIGMDISNPFHAALDLVTPPVMIARPGPPSNGVAGWFFHLDVLNIVITSVTALPPSRRGVRMRVFESAGRYARARLRCPRNVAEARLTDFRGQRLATLDVQGDTVVLDLAPREFTQLEIEFSIA
jgi:alpha-mannosidase